MPFSTSYFVKQGRFRNIRKVGEGHFCAVYFAEESNGDFVAVKEAFFTNIQPGETGGRFKKESRILSSISHTNIVSVHELLTDPETGEEYLVIEYANEGSLRDYMQKHGNLSEPLAISIAIDICAALDATWSHKIVHRDVKPGNILLFGDVESNTIIAKLADFGIAQDIQEASISNPRGIAHPGTKLYMAPEQATSVNLLDVRADIYALGITLWFMLTGKEYKLLLNEENPPVLRNHNVDTSMGIADIIRRAVEVEPAKRYSFPRQMALDLREVREGRSPVPPTIPLTYPASNSNQTMKNTGNLSRFWLPILVLLGLLLFGGGYAVSVLGNRAPFSIGSVETPSATISPTLSLPPTILPAESATGTIQQDAPNVTDTPEPTNTAEPTITFIPTDTPNPTNTSPPTDTPTPRPPATPRPLPTPFPDDGDTQGNSELSVTVDGVEFYSDQDGGDAAIWFRLTFTNNSQFPMEVSFDPRGIRAKDNLDNEYAELWNEIEEFARAGIVCTLNPVADAYDEVFRLDPGASYTVPQDRGVYLTLDRNYGPNNCNYQSKVEFETSSVTVNLPDINYRIDTPEPKTIRNLKWKLSRPSPT